ncbi:uncharacterized protein LOC133886496 [Phragmites australis]|uniref:uncharacterized protein LOC133886496 n=1 Tax=Phragmites australis TaxID=29695 RepID=UPI002D79785D|nr:uncharacterized protein LOC133886496 [Phragmites australis]
MMADAVHNQSSIQPADSNQMSTGTSQKPQGPATEDQLKQYRYQLKKYLLLLATLVATVTYAAGLNPPGGSWMEDTSGGQVAGDSILRETNSKRYFAFYVFNAVSFAASLLVSLLLLVNKEGSQGNLLLTIRTVMVVDLLGLMGAYAVGSSHDKFTTICASVLVSIVFVYVTVFILTSVAGSLPGRGEAPSADNLEKHEILMLLAIFAATIAYVAGLNPPGGFWRSTQEGHHTAGHPVLQAHHPNRYRAFFFCNTTAFVASLLAIILIVEYEKHNLKGRTGDVALYGLIITALLGLGGAYAAGSCRDSKHTAYVLGLGVPLVAYIFSWRLLSTYLPCIGTIEDGCRSGRVPLISWLENFLSKRKSWLPKCIKDEDLEQRREFIQLLAILAATITYQAGVDPPGGVWSDNGEGHHVGDPILLTTHPGRYKVFFYFNSAAFVASLVIMVMLQSERLVRRHALDAAIILDMFGLIGAYAAGSCRDTSTSIYTVAMAGAVLIYVVIHIVFLTLDRKDVKDEDKLKKNREVLLLLAILAATLTYQAGLTPPGGLWESDKFGHRAGFPVLQDKYPRRYKTFFYCNAASFMASVALIVLLMNPDLYRPGIRCYALFVCMVAGMFGLMGAYAAGSSLHLLTSVIVFVLVAALSVIVVSMAIFHLSKRQPEAPSRSGNDQQDCSSTPESSKYLMLVGILAASVTYLTGLKPPGGLWRDDGNGHSAGNPVLYDTNKLRYNVFFYSNSTSFIASIIVIACLLHGLMMMRKLSTMPPWPMHTTMLLNMLALLGAYAAGSAREWGTSRNVILLLIPILALVWLMFRFFKKGDQKENEPA